LTEAQRQSLKQPLGELVSGTPAHCNAVLKNVIRKEKPSLLVLVGDTVARESVQAGIKPDIVIIDNREMRGETPPFAHEKKHVFRTTNPAGMIDTDAWKTVDEAVRTGDSLVVVDGEEDLLTLVAILTSPFQSLVVYGQPKQGIVIVRVSAETKKEIRRMVEQMERRN
jgi:uncharacterized protein (UPF0218 family)